MAGSDHRCYAWVGVHSGDGGGVEADHFNLAVYGLRVALRYVDPNHQGQALPGLREGFQAFANHHRAFFEIAGYKG